MALKSENQIVKSCKIPIPTDGRQLVIPDIHGCYDTLKALLKQIELTKNDQLFFLGDYINRGPDSRGVLDFIFDFMQSGFQVYPLRGNHEQMALDSYERRLADKREGRWPVKFGRRRPKGLVDPEGLLLKQYADFFNSLPYYYELESYYLVHAGFDFFGKTPFEDYNSMIWIKDFIPDQIKTQGKRVVRGHVSYPLDEIKKSVIEGSEVVNLDGGCYKRRENGKGFLCCFDLTNSMLYYQANIETSLSIEGRESI